MLRGIADNGLAPTGHGLAGVGVDEDHLRPVAAVAADHFAELAERVRLAPPSAVDGAHAVQGEGEVEALRVGHALRMAEPRPA
jgi:hypothetical protein